MKVLQTIPYMLASQGGPSTCTCDLLQGLHEVGAQVDLLTAATVNPADRNLGAGSSWIKEVAMDYKTPLALSASTQAYLENSDYDIYHANTLWLHPVHATCSYARKVGKPYVLSTHGMLYPTALAVSGWKKKLMGALWFKKDVMRATCLHATCQQEAEYCRQFGYKGPIAVIPNAVVFPEFLLNESENFSRTNTNVTNDTNRSCSTPNTVDLCKASPLGMPSACSKKKTIGFLGRLHPIKKVENVLYALALLRDKLKSKENLDENEGMDVLSGRHFVPQNPDENQAENQVQNLSDILCFQIMGKFDDKYEQWLKDEVKRLNLEDCVEFVGFVSGKDKYDRLTKLSALMVPSAQENFGMIVPEALICGTPVYASLGTPWSELNECNAGWWESNEPETITKVILDILSKSDDELRAMGANGRKLMEEKYEQHKVAQMMVDLYKWINGEGPKPEFVYEL